MSRITKFLHQSCKYEAALLNEDGTPKRNGFGERQYAEAVSVRCREENTSKQIATAEGTLITCSSRFYIEPSISVQVEDKLNGHPVLHVSNLISGHGKNEGFECYV